MKEAAGEANMTVITIVLIGVVAAVGLALVPKLMTNIKMKTCCTNAGWYVSGNMCCNPKDPNKCKVADQTLDDGRPARVKMEENNMKLQKEFKECLGG